MASTELHRTAGGETSVAGYLPAANVVDGAAPAVLILPEIYGVNDEVRRVADFFAQNGFRAFAPDLLWREGSGLTFSYDERDAAREVIARQSVEDIVADIRRAAAFVAHRSASAVHGDSPQSSGASGASESDGGRRRLGIVAFGWSGQFALQAARDGGFDAVLAYYPGNLAGHVATAQAVRVALQLHFAARDTRTPLQLRGDFRRALADRDNVEIYTYADAEHGFANRGRAEYDAAAAHVADRRALEFLSRNLFA